MNYLLSQAATKLFSSHIKSKNNEETIKNSTKDHIVIRLPKALLFVGIITMLVGAALFIVMHTTCPILVMELLLVITFVAGLYLVVNSCTWKMEIFKNENYFIFRAFPYKTKKVFYSDCESYKIEYDTLFLKTKEKTFYIETKIASFDVILALLNKNNVKEVKKGGGKAKK